MLCALVLPLLIARAAPGQKAAETGPLVATDVVQGTPAEVWAAFTTKEGQESWQVAHAEIELRVGGWIKTAYEKAAKIGDASTIENAILAYDPERMLTLRIAKTPENFPFKTAAQSVWTVVYFTPAGEGWTRVTCKMLGWDATDESQKMRAFFAKGNAQVLHELKKHFEKKAAKKPKTPATKAPVDIPPST